MKIAAAVALLLMGATLPARAETGWELYNSCSHEEPGSEKLSCLRFLAGVNDTMVFVHKIATPGTMPTSCPPAGQTRGEFRQVFLGWAKMHQDLLTKDAADLVVAAAVEAYPCAKH